MDEKKISEYAARLYDALTNRVSISALSDELDSLDIDDAYAIQMENVKRGLAGGAKISGKKIGLTSKPMQEMLGVDEPDYGHLYESMDLTGKPVPADTLLQPKVEGEIAFILKEDIKGPDATVEDVLAATDYVVAALEIVDSRVKDWKIKLFDTVSDNASSGSYVLGAKKVPISEIDLIAEQMTFYKNGAEVNSGAGSAVLGNPAYCVAWLANKLWAYGVILGKGEVVLSGALSAAIEAAAGDTFKASFATLGEVTAEFV
ncbi:MAG: 2-keto-4-pentenoate hydratase [Clostridiales Family XIII bacterium]|jgi:2-keto-4-pentenoate hydratase|nr:2-keto-4-pentenoate hydratase [Clostridiales Family XIII bacterium]